MESPGFLWTTPLGTARLGRVALGLGAEVGCTRSASSALLLLLSWAGIQSQGTGKHPGVTAKDVKNLGPRPCGVTKGILDCSFLHCRMGEKPAFFFFFSFIFISWRLITLQHCSGFCHTLKWISHGFETSFPVEALSVDKLTSWWIHPGHQGEATLCLLYFVNKSRKYSEHFRNNSITSFEA